MLENIKKISDHVSREMAATYARASGRMPEQFQNNNKDIDFTSLKPIVESLCKKYEINALQGTIKSGTETPEGKMIDFAAFSQSFLIYAPALTKFVGELSQFFVIEAQENKIKIHAGKPSDKIDPCHASYFVQGEAINAVNLGNGDLLKLEGHQRGGASRSPDGTINVELNVEHDITINDFIHELVHAKIPEEIPQDKMPHDQIDKITNEIEKHLNLQSTSPISEIAALKAERLQILEIFKNFNKDLEKIMK